MLARATQCLLALGRTGSAAAAPSSTPGGGEDAGGLAAASEDLAALLHLLAVLMDAEPLLAVQLSSASIAYQVCVVCVLLLCGCAGVCLWACGVVGMASVCAAPLASFPGVAVLLFVAGVAQSAPAPNPLLTSPCFL